MKGVRDSKLTAFFAGLVIGLAFVMLAELFGFN